MFESEPDALDAQALLYASGVLEGEAAEAFEQRLGEDQSARETLCQAVQLLHALTLQPVVEPSPAYREAARRRLRQQLWRRRHHGHPLLWALLGAVAATVLLFFLSPRLCPHRSQSSPSSATSAPDSAIPAEDVSSSSQEELTPPRTDRHHSDHQARTRDREHPPQRYSEDPSSFSSPMIEH